MTGDGLPEYADLGSGDAQPPGSTWGLWGSDDPLGTLNLLGPDQVLDAVRSVRRGVVFRLEPLLDEPDPPLFGRPRIEHRVSRTATGARDDMVTFNTQASAQWDGFLHYAHRRLGSYNGLPEPSLGVHHWAARGIVGRGVLVDYARYRADIGRPLVAGEGEAITPAELDACLEHQRTEPATGDILVVRTGWWGWYRGLDRAARTAYAADVTSAGLAGKDLPEWLWNHRISAVAADNPAVEMQPARAGFGLLHASALAVLGLPLGELWWLDELADDCAATGTYDFLLTSAPLMLRGGAASPPNVLALR